VSGDGRRKKQIPIQGSGGEEGWESMVEEESAGTLAENPELEEALREAADALDESGRVAPDQRDAPAAEAAEAAGEAPAEAPGEAPKGERTELELAQERLLRLQADFENFRRRALKERTEDRQFGHQNLVKDLLSTVDNLERAIDHARGAHERGGGDFGSLLQGVELVQRELLVVLGKHGVSEIEALGKPFDPALHEAMAQAPDGSVPANTVVQVLEKGYQLRGRLLRPARVIVARDPGGGEPGEAESREQSEVENETDGEGQSTD
jgi:molecular chaperone GrpE